ncbi:MAG: adenosine kinase [Prevotellaceae bacterium]|jgi:sugar/nucleoside kinase (ribokinase family)|nr:adenosine kinase [Prevotellaceae bacterium]
MDKILGIGNALVDILAIFKNDEMLQKYNLPKGSMTHVDEETTNKIFADIKHQSKYDIVAGGSAANTVNGLSKLGIKTAFIGKTGKDELGNFFINDMKKNGTTPKLLTTEKTTGNCKVLITPDGERTMCTYLGAAIDLNEKDLYHEQFEGYDYLHIEGYLVQNHGLMKRALELAKRHRITISLDMASFNVVAENKKFMSEILNKYVDIIFANEEEARIFTGREPQEALEILAEICKIAIVKIGSAGSYVKQGNEFYKIKAISAKAIDATGAGDLYASGFLYGMAKKLPIEICGEIGSLCAGNIVEVVGTKLSDEKWNNIKKILNY